MDRYPSPLEGTRDTFGRWVAGACATTAFGALVGVLLSGRALSTIWWLLAVVVAAIATVGGLSYLLWDERRLRQFDNVPWTTEQWNDLREDEYRRQHGVFLTYILKPADRGDSDGHRWWTAEVQLVQHNAGPLSDHKIKEVEYAFGPQFSERTITRHNAEECFRYETDLYGSALVLGRVVLKSRFRRPLFVEQYIDLSR